jgi:protein-tyrosine kinase
LEASKETYDLVVFDSPPVMAVSDGMMLAALCDGVIFVVRAGYAPAAVTRRATRHIEQVRGHIIGMVLNRVDLRKADAEHDRYGPKYYRTKPAKDVA